MVSDEHRLSYQHITLNMNAIFGDQLARGTEARLVVYYDRRLVALHGRCSHL